MDTVKGVVEYLTITLLQIFHRLWLWKKFKKSVNIWQRYGQTLVGTFLWPTLYSLSK